MFQHTLMDSSKWLALHHFTSLFCSNDLPCRFEAPALGVKPTTLWGLNQVPQSCKLKSLCQIHTHTRTHIYLYPYLLYIYVLVLLLLWLNPNIVLIQYSKFSILFLKNVSSSCHLTFFIHNLEQIYQLSHTHTHSYLHAHI